MPPRPGPLSPLLAATPLSLLALVLALALWATGAGAQAGEPLTIRTKSGAHAFTVEVARNDADRAQGLMYRRSMPPDHGMLFDFEKPQLLTMWMKNTYIPLDMLFIRADGTIARIAADAEPLSTQVIPSGEPVPFVLELNAGTAARLGIAPGDRVEHPAIKPR